MSLNTFGIKVLKCVNVDTAKSNLPQYHCDFEMIRTECLLIPFGIKALNCNACKLIPIHVAVQLPRF